MVSTAPCVQSHIPCRAWRPGTFSVLSGFTPRPIELLFFQRKASLQPPLSFRTEIELLTRRVAICVPELLKLSASIRRTFSRVEQSRKTLSVGDLYFTSCLDNVPSSEASSLQLHDTHTPSGPCTDVSHNTLDSDEPLD